MTRSIFFKTFFALLLIMALVVLLVFLFSSNIIRQQSLDSIHHDLGQLAAALQRNFVPLLVSGDAAAPDVLAKELGREIDVRLTVIAPDGRVHPSYKIHGTATGRLSSGEGEEP